jgi:diguanylate cyclase (GGDEF)-like protein
MALPRAEDHRALSDPDEHHLAAQAERSLALGRRIHWEEPRRALQLAEQAETWAGQIGSSRLRGRALVLRAAVAMRLGDLERTFELIVQAERDTRRCNEPDLRADLALTHSRLSFLSGAYAAALEQAQEAIELADEHGLDEIRLLARRALNLVLGNVEPGLLANSVEELLELTLELGDRREESMARNDRAYDLLLRGHHTEAEEEIGRAIAIARELGSEGRFALAYAVGTRAEVRLATGDASAAIADFDESLALADTEGEPEPYLTCITLQVKVNALAAEGRLDDAIETGLRGLDLLGDRVPSVRALLLRSVACALRMSGRLDDAYTALDESARLERDAFRELTARQLALQRTSLEARAVRHEAELLAAKNTELEQLVTQLGSAHEELEKRMKQLERLRDRLREQADRDWLTGLRNRRFLARQFGRIASAAVAAGKPLSLAVVDIDQFKSVNDRFGHEVGDSVLRAVADVLAATVRSSDVVVRSGGEEFLIVMPEADTGQAAACCERLRAELESRRWDQLGGRGFTLTLSAGVASTEEELDPNRLLSVADTRLYEAKARGRNCVVAPAA